MTVGELFGTLQASVTEQWREHLQSGNHAEHVILDEYYKEMPELIDALIEAYQADHDIVKDYSDTLDGQDLSPVEYLTQLKELTLEGREIMDSPELESLCDDILTLIDSVLYKLKNLVKESHEPKSLVQYLHECLDNE